MSLDFKVISKGKTQSTRGNYLELSDLLPKQKHYIRGHLQLLQSTSHFKSMSSNELIEPVTDIIQESIMTGLHSCDFIGIQTY